MKRFIIFALLATVLVLSGVGCATLGGAKKLVTDTDYINEYNFLVQDVVNAQEATVTCKNCVVLYFTDINTQVGIMNTVMQAQVLNTAAYAQTTQAFFNSPNDKLGGKTPNQALQDANTSYQNGLNAYKDANGNPLPPSQLDLAKLANTGALPSQLALSLNVVALTYQQAPMPPFNSQVATDAQRVVTVDMDKLFACTKAGNDAIAQYNKDRKKVSGEIAAKLAEILKLSELPVSLPYFEVQGATTVNPVPTFGLPK